MKPYTLSFPQAERSLSSLVGDHGNSSERIRSSRNDRVDRKVALSTISIPAILMLLLFLFSGCGKQPPLHQDAPLKENRIIIPLADVADKKAHFFSYRKAGKRINFFVRTDSTGVVSAYYDACFTCYRHKKGYRQEGAALICNECSMKFGLFDKKWEEKDGCNPIYLKSAVEGNNLIIDADVIEKGAKLF